MGFWAPGGRGSKIASALLSAFLFELAFPPFNMRWAAFFCLVPWILSLRGCTRWGSFRAGYLMGFFIVMAQMQWLQTLATRWTENTLLGLVPWLLCCFLGGFYFAFAGVLVRWCLRHGRLWAIPLVWAGIEVIRSYMPALAFPWFLLATPLTPYPALIQLSYFGTIYLVSGWVCAVNVFLYLVVSRWRSSLAAVEWIYLAGVLAFPLLSVMWYERPVQGRPVTLAAGQSGWDMAFGDQSKTEQEIGRRVDDLIRQARAEGVALLVLPEGIVSGGSYPPVPAFHLPPDLPLLFGGQRGAAPAYQTAFAYDEGHWSYADKSRLVVFGEYVPGRKFLPFLQSFKLPSGDLKPSNKVSAIKVGGLTVGPLLCFEGLFWDVAHDQSENGSQMLALMSIDDWYMGTPAPEQLQDAAVWRAIETGLPVIRAASLGYTEAVDQRGRLLARLPLGETGLLPVTFMLEDHPARNPSRALVPWFLGAFPVAVAAGLLARAWLWRVRAS